MQKTSDFARFAWNTSDFVIPKPNNENRIEDAFGLFDGTRREGPIRGPSRVFPNKNLPKPGRKDGGVGPSFCGSNVKTLDFLSQTCA